MEIRYISYKDLDKKKWDNCIAHSLNRLVYCRSFYLDALAKKWDALVSGDYETVMPLTYRNKWGVKYLYQPAFIQQTGIYAAKKLTTKQVNSFIEAASQHFKFAEITLNFSNPVTEQSPLYKFSYRNNFILDLSRSYDDLYLNYLPNFTKSLRRIKKFDLQYHLTNDYKAQVDLYRKLYSERLHDFSEKDFSAFISICKKMNADHNLITRSVSNKDNEVLASVILLKDGSRLYNIISCIKPEGKKYEANYFLYDRIIHEFSGSGLLLDLEGSDVAGIAGFYKKFNPENQPYPHIKFNKLPAVIKLLKP